MEVNDLKNLWRDSFSDKESKLSPEEINERLKLKSKSNFLMRKVKRSFQFELIFGAFFTILGLFKLIPETNTMKEVLYLGLFVLVMIVLFGFVFMKYRKFNGIKILQDQLRPALEQWIKILEKYAKFIMIEDAGHGTMHDNKTQNISAIKEFLAKTDNK